MAMVLVHTALKARDFVAKLKSAVMVTAVLKHFVMIPPL